MGGARIPRPSWSLPFLVLLAALATARGQASTCGGVLCETGAGSPERWALGESTFKRVARVAGSPTGPEPAPLQQASAVLQSGVAYEATGTASAFVAAWAQLIALDLAGFAADDAAPVSFLYSACDGSGECGVRNGSVPGAAGTAAGVLNAATPRIDGEPVYGSTPQRAAALRAFSGGLLKEDGLNGPPLNAEGLSMGGPAARARQQRLTGSPEGNSSPALLALIATLDERLYREARVRVVAMIQRVTVFEFAPLLLGGGVAPPYRGYNASADGRTALEFAGAAALVHRTLLPQARPAPPRPALRRTAASEPGQVYARLDGSGAEAPEGPLPALAGLYTASFLPVRPAPPVARGRRRARGRRGPGRAWRRWCGPGGDGGLAGGPQLRRLPAGRPLALPDAPTVDLARARALALPSYGAARAAYRLPVPAAWEEVARDAATLRALQAVYPSPGEADLLVGLLAEREAPGALLGPLGVAMWQEALRCARDADAGWYEALPPPVRDEARARRFTQLVVAAWAPAIPRLPRSVFMATPPRWREADFGAGELAAGAGANGTGGAGASVRLNGALTLAWRLLPATEEIEVTVACACEGWVGMGLGSSMADADVIWMRHNASGLPQVLDARASGFRSPVLDGRQDVRLVEATRGPGAQSFRWRRAWDTGDPDDAPFRPGPQPLIFAWRPSGSELGMHAQANTLRGTLDFWAGSGSGSGAPGAFVGAGQGYGNTYIVHAVAMAVAWGAIVPASLFVVRYLKHYSFWIDLHRAGMQVALTVTIPAAAAAFAGRPRSEIGSSHGYFGVAIAVVAAGQLLVGQLVKQFHIARRPPAAAELFRRLHRAGGRLLCLGALANLLLGVELLQPAARATLVAWLVLLAALFGSAEVLGMLSRRRAAGVHDSLNRKKVAHITSAEFDRAVRLGSPWILLGDRVFDVAPVLASHPGGAALLHAVIGQDISAFLYSSSKGQRATYGLARPHQHSLHAHRQLMDLCVAVLKPDGARPEEEAASDGAEGQLWSFLDSRVVCASRKPIYRVRFVSDTALGQAEEIARCGQHFEVTARVGGREVHRHYSLVRLAGAAREAERPLAALGAPPSATDDLGEAAAVQELWIRRYPNGAMSRFLTDPPPGAQIRVRGPLGLGLRLTAESEGDLVAVVAGTGILPILDLPRPRPRLALRRRRLAPAPPLPARPVSFAALPTAAAFPEAGGMSLSAFGTLLLGGGEGPGAAAEAWGELRPSGSSSPVLPGSPTALVIHSPIEARAAPRAGPAGRVTGAQEPGGGVRERGARARAGEAGEGAPRELRLTLAACFESPEDVPELAWLEECAALCPAFEFHLFVQRAPSAAWLEAAPHRRAGRIDGAFVRERLLARAPRLLHLYICGPPIFAHEMRKLATDLGVEPGAIVSL
eukprot:tig00000718_g3689.t1